MKKNVPQRIMDRVKYIYNLTQRGEYHEAQAAQKKLELYLKKYDLSLEDITLDMTVGTHYMSYKLAWEVQLFGQIGHAMQLKSGRVRGKKQVWVECNLVQLADIKAQWGFYKSMYKEELETFYIAFIHAQHIFPPVLSMNPQMGKFV